MPIIGCVKEARAQDVELEGPYECLHCKGHFMLDTTFLDQVSDTITCPYCTRTVVVPETF